MRKFTTGAILAGATAILVALLAPQVGAGDADVCDNLSTGHLSGGGQTSITFTAPPGNLVVTYCVKAGSANQGDGPVDVNVNPAQQTVTITHPSGKEISHYSVLYKPTNEETTTTTSSSSTTTTTEPETTTSTTSTSSTSSTSSTTTTEVGTSTSTTDPGTTTSTAPTSTSTSTSTEPTTSSSEPTTTTSLPGQSTTTSPPTTGPTTSTTPPVPSVTAITPVCQADTPYIDVTFGPETAFNGQPVTVEFIDNTGIVVATHTATWQAGTTVRFIYPGASENPQDWPGWRFDGDEWVPDPTDDHLRDGLTVVVSVNPAVTGTVTYPPATSNCADPPQTPPEPCVPIGEATPADRNICGRLAETR